jgi:hypothetical protein
VGKKCGALRKEESQPAVGQMRLTGDGDGDGSVAAELGGGYSVQ